jgi:hypothetical protein
MSVGVSKLARDICLLSDTSPFMQGEGSRDRLLAMEAFQKIPGIGYVSLFLIVILGSLSRICRERTATNLVNAGAASVSDLRLPQYESLLTSTQKVGVLYGDHMTRPIPRAEAEEIAVRANSCVILSIVRIILITVKGLHSLPHLLQL